MLGADFKHLQLEVSEKTNLLASLSKDVQDVIFYNILPMLGDREALSDLMDMVSILQFPSDNQTWKRGI